MPLNSYAIHMLLWLHLHPGGHKYILWLNFIVFWCLNKIFIPWMHTKHIEVNTKWPPFHRRHFHTHFPELHLLHSYSNFTEIYSHGSSYQCASIGSDDGLAPSRRQANVLMSVDPVYHVYCRIYTTHISVITASSRCKNIHYKSTTLYYIKYSTIQEEYR